MTTSTATTSTTKKFLCLCYYEAAAFQAWTPEDHAAIGEACAPHDRALRATGKAQLNASLSDPSSARVIRPGASGRPIATEGPYHATPEPVGAVFIVEAQDMDEAVRIASLHPGVNVKQFASMKGGIEVRELGGA
jgi:hypothetical protein